MKTKKKLMSMLLAFALCLGLVNVNTICASASVVGTEELNEAPVIELGTTYTFDVNGRYDADLSLSDSGYGAYYYYRVSVPQTGRYTYTLGSSYGTAKLVIKNPEFNEVASDSVFGYSATETMKLEKGTYYVGINAYSDDDTNGVFCFREEGKSMRDAGYNEAEKTYTSEEIGVEGGYSLLHCNRLALNQTYTFDVKGYYDANLSLSGSGYGDYYYYKILVPQTGRYTYTLGSSYGTAKLIIKDSKFNEIVSTSISGDSATDTMKLEKGTYYVGINAYSDDYTNGVFCFREEGKSMRDVGYNESQKVYTTKDTGVEGGYSLLHCNRIALDKTYTFDVKGYYDANLSLSGSGYGDYYYYKILVPQAGRYTYALGSSYGTVKLIIKDSKFNEVASVFASTGSVTDTIKLEKGTYYIGLNAYTDDKTNGKFSLKVESTLAKVVISSASAKVKGLTVKWKKVSNATGYQVQYSTNSKMTGSKSKKLTASKTSFSVSGLKAKQTYYVRVRAYKKNSNGKLSYGSWSKIKVIKTK